MDHIGMDLGKKESQIAILTESGEKALRSAALASTRGGSVSRRRRKADELRDCRQHPLRAWKSAARLAAKHVSAVGCCREDKLLPVRKAIKCVWLAEKLATTT